MHNNDAVHLALIAAAGCAPLGACGKMETRAYAALDVSAHELVDLTHAFGPETVYWPTAPSRFEKQPIFEGRREDGMFYSAFEIATPRHGGTHMDAPISTKRATRREHVFAPSPTYMSHAV